MLQRYLSVLPRILMIVTDEEDRLIQEIMSSVRPSCEVQVWNAAFGLLEGNQYIEEWVASNFPENPSTSQLNRVLARAYRKTTSPGKDNVYYVVLDADLYLRDPATQRLLKNIAIAGHQNPLTRRSIILVSQNGKIPEALAPFVEVYDYREPSDEVIRETLLEFEQSVRDQAESDHVPDNLKETLKTFTVPYGREENADIPEDFLRACRNMTVFQLKESLSWLLTDTNLKITSEGMKERRRSFLKKNPLLNVVNTKMTFEDLAGLERLKTWLRGAGASFSEEGRKWGLPPTKGVLLVGIPGCGKSLTAKALGNEWGMTLIHFDPGRVFAGRVGESERNMRRALNSIEAMSPCIVWIDEIDKGFSGLKSSARSDSGTTARVIGTFLSWYQDHEEEVFVIATANAIEALPPEMISRFEEVFFVDLPNTDARKQCFRIQLDRYWNPAMGSQEDIDLGILAEDSEGLTGREIDKAVKEGLRHAFTHGKAPSTEDFLQTLHLKPPLSQVMSEEIQSLVDWVAYDPERDEGIRARYAADPFNREEDDLLEYLKDFKSEDVN